MAVELHGEFGEVVMVPDSIVLPSMTSKVRGTWRLNRGRFWSQ